MKRLLHWFGRRSLWIFAWLLCGTLRIRYEGREYLEALWKRNQNCVIGFWHGSMLTGWFVHRPESGRPVAALVSQSSDGELLSSVLTRWGYSMIRGSSNVGGREAMELMQEAVKKGYSLCITPDGPQGPRHEMKMGAVRVAQTTHVPLLLAGIAAREKKILHSWDSFEVPMPFSRILVSYGEPMTIDPDASGSELEKYLRDAEARLRELQKIAESKLKT